MCLRIIVMICFVAHSLASTASVIMLHPASDHVLVAGQQLIVSVSVSGLSSSAAVFVRVSHGSEIRDVALNSVRTGFYSGDVSDFVTKCTATGFPLTLRAVATLEGCAAVEEVCSAGTAQEIVSNATCVHVVCSSNAHSWRTLRMLTVAAPR